ncbi:hypothetical protein M9H77_06369 [Catharanthus roseus]|uniref:Uncharacterized protein n=1 Tax=Catharanthus roseus TaxID=4058 RepID=A0ACC0BS17_CATRO|nr:hypothetical protein M9H77_06369 [Catharanthus roseus]
MPRRGSSLIAAARRLVFHSVLHNSRQRPSSAAVGGLLHQIGLTAPSGALFQRQILTESQSGKVSRTFEIQFLLMASTMLQLEDKGVAEEEKINPQKMNLTTLTNSSQQTPPISKLSPKSVKRQSADEIINGSTRQHKEGR